MSENIKGKVQMDRRGFLGAAALGAASLGALAIAGCSPQAQDEEKKDVGSTNALAEGGSAYVAGVPDSWDREADVVVLGSGTVLSAAVKAQADGLETIVLEKADMAGGTTSFSGGKCYICCASFVDDDRAKAKEYITKCNVDDYVTEAMIDAYLDNGGEMIDFLIEKTGANWQAADRTDLQPDWPGSSSGMRSLNVPNEDDPTKSSGGNFTSAEIKAFQDMGGTLLTGTPAIRLVARPLEDGRQEVLGVIANDGKNDLAIKARKAVIIGTGSFDWDREMCKQYLPFTAPYTFQIETCTGDGFKMAQAVGADCGMTTQGWGCPVDIYAYDQIESGSVELPINASKGDFYETMFQGRRIGFGATYIIVSRNGQRFFAEPGGYSSMDAWAGLDSHGDYQHRYLPYSFAIFDAEGAASSEYDTLDPMPGWLTKGETIEELAQNSGIDERNLRVAFDRWNSDAENGGVDTEYGRTNIKPLGAGPYYAVKCTQFYNGTHGGIKVNEKAQVVSTLGDIVPRLYATSNAASIGGPGRVYPGAGGSIGATKVFGYIAAKDAATLEDWQ